MKKNVFIIMSILLSILLIGCENKVAIEATEQGKIELYNKEYDKALSLFNLAIDKGSDDEEIKDLIKIITNFNIGKELIKERKFEETKKILDSINKEYINYSIKDEINNLKEKIVLYEENNKFISNKISAINQLIGESKYEDAKIVVEELLSSEREMSESQKQEIDIQIKIISDKTKNIKKDSEISSEYISALKRAQEYSDKDHLSKATIYDELITNYGDNFRDVFTSSAAQYAVDNVKADWNKNALNFAKQLNEELDLTYPAMIHQLTVQGGGNFTDEEAMYAVDHLEW